MTPGRSSDIKVGSKFDDLYIMTNMANKCRVNGNELKTIKKLNTSVPRCWKKD